MKTDPDLTSARAAATVGSGVLAEMADETSARAVDTVTEPEARSQWQLIRRRFLRHKLAVFSLLVLITLFMVSFAANTVAPYELTPELNAETLADAGKGPSPRHWFGTDELGRDQLTRVLHAGQVSLKIGLVVALVSSMFGTAVGAVAGFFGGKTDQWLMRLTDLMLVMPPLAILLIAGKKYGSNINAFIIVLAAVFWMTVARVVRGVFLSLKEKEYVEAARASGASSFRIILRHMLPNTVGPILVNTTLVVGVAILTESTLSFLGFGIQPPEVSWGNLLEQSRGKVGTPDAYLVYFPGLFITLTVLAINYLGDGLRDAFDPQSKH